MSCILLSRIIGAIILGIIGAISGHPLFEFIQKCFPNLVAPNNNLIVAISAAVFFILGFIITPYITIKPIEGLKKLFRKASPQTLLSGLAGLLLGFVAAAITAYPLSLLPPPFGSFMPFVGVVLFGYLFAILLASRTEDIQTMFKSVSDRIPSRGRLGGAESSRRILVDTSAIIDGRIVDIAETGFLGGSLIIPRFVLNELQFVSDSSDSLRRQRGRRGLETLTELQESKVVPITISDLDVEGVREVDDRLVILARQMNCPILTNDFNLNRVAELQGVEILNINDLANAVKVVLLPGESFTVKIIQEGKEYNQGVGYLDDGTMVVVENGEHYMNEELYVTVTKILQTSAGRMIFAKPENE